MTRKIFYLGDFIKGNGPSTVDLSLKAELGGCDIFFQQSNYLPTLRSLLFFLQATNIHVSGVSFFGAIFVILGRILGKYCTYTMHGYLANESKYRDVKVRSLFVEKVLLSCSHKIIVVSTQMKRVTKYYNKAYAIPNGVDLVRERQSLNQSKSNVITLIGGGRPEKRHLAVCKVIAELNQEGYEFSVNLFGEIGSETKELQQFNFVKDFGFVHKNIVEESLQVSKIFIQYSTWESFSLSVADAINSECNVITSPHVGINDYITPNNFYKIVHDDLELKLAIREMMLNDDLQYRVPKNNLLSWYQVAQKYLALWSNKL